MVNKPTLADRLARRLVRMPNGCLEWTGYRNARGYGQIGLGPRSKGLGLTHRVAWELAHNRRIPRGRFVRHRCDNPPCCEPSHLVTGTNADNVRDMVTRGRVARGGQLPQTRLTDEQVREIRRDYNPRYGPPKLGGRRSNADELAAKYGVGRMYIMHIASRTERSDVAA